MNFDEVFKRYIGTDTALTRELSQLFSPKPTAVYPEVPKRIIVDEQARVTVVLWHDGTKTIVRCSELDNYDPYAAYCAAFAKRCYGTNSRLKRIIESCTVHSRPQTEKENDNQKD